MSSPWAHNAEEARVSASIDAKIDRKANPMHSRCGLEDCDCGYTIEKLMDLVNHVLYEYETKAPRSECWYKAASKLIDELSGKKQAGVGIDCPRCGTTLYVECNK